MLGALAGLSTDLLAEGLQQLGGPRGGECSGPVILLCPSPNLLFAVRCHIRPSREVYLDS